MQMYFLLENHVTLEGFHWDVLWNNNCCHFCTDIWVCKVRHFQVNMSTDTLVIALGRGHCVFMKVCFELSCSGVLRDEARCHAKPVLIWIIWCGSLWDWRMRCHEGWREAAALWQSQFICLPEQTNSSLAESGDLRTAGDAAVHFSHPSFVFLHFSERLFKLRDRDI